MDPLQQIIGIKLAHLVGGFFGGVVGALVDGGTWLTQSTIIVVGTLTAAKLTPLALKVIEIYLGPTYTGQEIDGGITFLVGLTGMLICKGFLKMAGIWARRPRLPLPGPQP